MAVRLEGIHFLVTYRCTYACDHCFVWGSPDAEGTMTLAQLTSVIDQGAELGLDEVYFEGGEPTLAYPVVLAAAKHARELGLDVGMVSNCFWATSLEDARVWLTPLAELGISDLSLSSYAYFVEDADEARLRNAVLAARDLGIPASVLEVAAPADIGVPGACSGDVGRIMHKGRAAVARASVPAARISRHLPVRGLHRAGPRSRRPGRRTAALPGHQRRQRLRRRRRQPGARGPRVATPGGPPAGARRLRPAGAPGRPRDPRRWSLGPRRGGRPRAGALTVR
jgi:Radical SAM superfamily